MPKLSIAIPSKTEKFLYKTTKDVLEKATGNIEIFPILDGYDTEEIIEDKRVKYIRLPATQAAQKRHGINIVASICSGDYLMSLDAHCMMAEGFDEVLLKDIEDDWVVVPRRNRLDAENWCLQTQVDDRPPIDYEYLMWPLQFDPPAFHGFKWDARTRERWDIPIDNILTFQGSMWVMSRKHFHRLNLMQIDGYQGLGQEAEEISWKTYCSGGRVVVNKNTSYGHLHKGNLHGRMYFLDKKEQNRSYAYSYDFWMNNRPFKGKVRNWGDLIDSFMPIPKWPTNWREELNYRD